MAEKRLLRALRGEVVSPPPVWLMRQAGRYLPEYRELRARAGSFLDLCYTPALAAEVTLQPLRRFELDAAILFADILLIPQAMGLDLRFVEGEGPRLRALAGRADIEALAPVDRLDATLGPVYETVSRVRAELGGDVALIGFAGAPWTVASYMIAGQGTPDQAPARAWLYREPEALDGLVERLVDATVHYLARQIEAGAEAVKLFDSWAGSLPGWAFERFAVRPAAEIAARLKARHPTVPIIGFPRGAGIGYRRYAAEAGMDCVAVDAMTEIPELRQIIGNTLTLQGNIDPMLLAPGGPDLARPVGRLMAAVAGTPHVVNLGHGITPDADPDRVRRLVELVRGWRP